MAQQLVLFDHDGGVDDYLATLLLMTMETVQPLGVIVTPADCYLQPAVSATRKILDLVGRTRVPVVASHVRGINAFPSLYRRDSFVVDHFPILNEAETLQTPLLSEDGPTFMVKTLQAASEPVTLLMTGPLTTLAIALDQDPGISEKIRHLVWMGGALGVRGNIEPSIEPGQDGTAEWNAYWDPQAVERVWQSDLPIVLCPLDLTNQVPVTSEFVCQLGRQRRHPLSDLAGQCYALVIPQDYYFWDVLATTYLERPDLFQTTSVETAVVREGPSQGRTYLKAGGRPITLLREVDVEGFYAYILGQWAR